MNRIITILVTIFILLLLYIWISHVWGSDKPKHPQQIVDATQTEHTLGADDNNAEVDTFLNTSPDPVKRDTVAKTSATSNSKTQVATEPAKTTTSKNDPVKSETVKTEPAKKPVTAEKNTTATKTETKTKSTPAPAPVVKPSPSAAKKTSLTTSTEGKHLVIAGNFLQQVNAEQRMAELKKAGIKDAEIINFDLSEYHTVCAGRFTDVNDARKLVKKLKDYHNIDAYVRVGN